MRVSLYDKKNDTTFRIHGVETVDFNWNMSEFFLNCTDGRCHSYKTKDVKIIVVKGDE